MDIGVLDKGEDHILRLARAGLVRPDQTLTNPASGRTMLLLPIAIKWRWCKLTKYLIEKGAPVNRYSRAFTSLMIASGMGAYELVEMLLQAQADPNLRARKSEDTCGETALMLAAENGDLQT